MDQLTSRDELQIDLNGHTLDPSLAFGLHQLYNDTWLEFDVSPPLLQQGWNRLSVSVIARNPLVDCRLALPVLQRCWSAIDRRLPTNLAGRWCPGAPNSDGGPAGVEYGDPKGDAAQHRVDQETVGGSRRLHDTLAGDSGSARIALRAFCSCRSRPRVTLRQRRIRERGVSGVE